VDDDVVLLQEWRAGDKRAGEDLFGRHFADVLRFFESKAWSKAEDLTQQTFLECVGARDRFRGDSSFRTYLFAIAWNLLRQHFRRATGNDQLDFEVSSVNDLAAELPSPSSKLDRARESTRIRRALTRLPLAQQALLEYHYWHELDAAALSQIFGLPAGSIRVRLLRARNALRTELETVGPTQGISGDSVGDALSESLGRLEATDRRFDRASDGERRF
jgi:RNA polymerase sigma factor (sigma-70 family)